MIDLSFEKIDGWIRTCAKMKHYKTAESNQRKEICDELFGERTRRFIENVEHSVVPEGTTTAKNYKIVAVSKTSFKIDEAELQRLKDDGLLTEAAEACFERKLSVKEGPLRKLSKDSPVWRAITEKPGTPTLTIEVIEDED